MTVAFDLLQLRMGALHLCPYLKLSHLICYSSWQVSSMWQGAGAMLATMPNISPILLFYISLCLILAYHVIMQSTCSGKIFSIQH